MSDQDSRSKLEAPDMRGVFPALVRAGQRAREIAARTGTPVYVMRDGKIVDLNPATAGAKPKK